MLPECSLPYSQEPITIPYPEPDKYSPLPPILSLRSILILNYLRILFFLSLKSPPSQKKSQSIYHLLFIMETQCVLCEVETQLLYTM
jgi:hypothetical protein